MINVEIIFLVEKPIYIVFQRISDIANYHQWVPAESGFFIENKITSQGPFGLGTTYTDKLKWHGKATGEIIKYSPPSNVKFQQTTWFGIRVLSALAEYILTGRDGYTEVVHRFEATPFGIFKLLGPFLSIVIRSERERTCRAIKQGLERDL
jgi:hypothetical protein